METFTQQDSKALAGSLARTEHFSVPDPGSRATKTLSRIDDYDDYQYVDCPYDDYQDYSDSPSDD